MEHIKYIRFQNYFRTTFHNVVPINVSKLKTMTLRRLLKAYSSHKRREYHSAISKLQTAAYTQGHNDIKTSAYFFLKKTEKQAKT